MSTIGLVLFAIMVVAACYATRCLQRGGGREDVPPEIEKRKLLQ